MNNVLKYVLAGLVFLFPLFFLPLTQEFYLTSKLYLLSFGALAVILISTAGLFISKKINWKKGPLDASVILVVLAAGLSVIIASPNKVGALMNLNFGIVALLALAIFFFALSQVNRIIKVVDYLNVLTVSALITALVSVVFFLRPFKNVVLPQAWQFLTSQNFNPIGGRIDLAVFLGFVVVVLGAKLWAGRDKRLNPFQLGTFFVVVLALALSLYSIFQPLNQGLSFVLPPYRLSWYAAIETMKNPLNALFGMGVDNYSSVFTRVKDLAYNQTNLWQIASFNISRSAVLHIMTVAGIFGLLAFGLLILTAFRTLQNKIGSEEKRVLLFGLGYVVLAYLLMPPSLVMLFLLFFIVSLVNKQAIHESQQEAAYMPLGGLMPVYVLILALGLGFVGGSGYFLGRAYASEYYFKKSLDGLANRNAAELYNNQRRAIQLNPYNEGYRISFSQTNLLIANNVVTRARQSQQNQEAQEQNQPLDLSEQERQTITQAVQAGIQEAKAAVILNPQKATSWENLARTYRSIINVAQGADVWTLTSYQRAIALDGRNPVYYLNLGGVFYAAGNYQQASQLFSQAAALKPDWANAHYNLAWALYQQENYQAAAQQMQAVVTLLEKNKDSDDYKKAQQELADFKSKIPAESLESTGEGELQLPSQPQPQLSPKLELPDDAEPPASPSAR